MRPSQNLPLPPRIYPTFQQLYATLPESTPPSQNIPPFSTTVCDPPRIYPSLPAYTPIFNNYFIMRRSQNLSLPPRIYPPFNNCMRHSQKLSFPQRIHPTFLTTIFLVSFLQLYMISQESTPQSLNVPPFLESTYNCERIYHSLPVMKNILGERGRFWECRKIL